MSLAGKVVETSQLNKIQRYSMFEILNHYFDNVRWSSFNKDLNEKDWAILLTEPARGQIVGFSTLRLIDDVLDDVPLRAFFSGDTIIDLPYRASLVLEKTWIRFAYAHALRNPLFRYYWFLIVNSYRSYRYLPVYAKTYYPNPDYGIPEFECRLLDHLAAKRYGKEYDPHKRVIRLKNSGKLRPGVSDIGEKELRDTRIAFFEQCNPEWMDGVALACLTEISLHNARPAVTRIIGEWE